MNTHTTIKVLNEVTDALRDLLAEHEQYWTSQIRGNKDRRAHLVRELIDNDPQVIAARRALTRAICILDKAEQEAA
jgi:hypothetical protein